MESCSAANLERHRETGVRAGRELGAGACDDLARALGVLAERGVSRAYLPEKAGGAGLSAVEVCALLEGLGEGTGDARLALAVGVHELLVAVPLWRFGAAGRRPRGLAAASLLEADGGAATANATTRGERAAGGWRLSGAKPLVVAGGQASAFLVTAVTEPLGHSAFLIPADAPGLTVRPADDPSGLLGRGVTELVLDGCEVGRSALLGTPGRARSELLPLLAALDRSLLLAPWVGVLRAVTGRMAALVRTRESFARPLADSQSVRASLADMRIGVELCCSVVRRASWELDASARPDRLPGAVAKLRVAHETRRVLRAVARILGPAALAADPLLARAQRDLPLLDAAGGAEVMHPVIADALRRTPQKGRTG